MTFINLDRSAFAASSTSWRCAAAAAGMRYRPVRPGGFKGSVLWWTAARELLKRALWEENRISRSQMRSRKKLLARSRKQSSFNLRRGFYREIFAATTTCFTFCLISCLSNSFSPKNQAGISLLVTYTEFLFLSRFPYICFSYCS